MYLGVPLLRANEIQIEVSLLLKNLKPTQHLVTLSKQDTIGDIRNILEARLKLQSAKLVFCEVTKHK